MAPSLRLLTWNVGRLHLGARLNRWLGLDSRAADAAVPHVAAVIAHSGAQVVALQELARAEQIDRLALMLGRGWAAAVVDREACDRRVGLLALRTLDPQFHTVQSAGGRAAAAVSLHGGLPGAEPWAIMSLHLDAFDDTARHAQARRLLAWATERNERGVVLAGDLNIDLTHPAARRPHDHATFRAISAQLTDLGARAGATALLGRRVDYVLARAGVVGQVRVLRGRRVPLGDHDPVLAELSLREAPPTLTSQSGDSGR